MSYSFIGRYFNKYKQFFKYEVKDYSFKVDLQYGELYLSRRLFSFSGKHLPLDLSLNYSQLHINVYDNLHLYTGFPRGFKTNFHVFLEYDSDLNRYVYEDSDGFMHHFKLAVNSSTLYYDEFGTGLMLMAINNGYEVFDDNGNYQRFDQYGRLVKIHKRITDSHQAEQNIVYVNNTDYKIYSITDNYGRTIYFTYNANYVLITYNNNTVITLYLSNYLLTKISKNIDNDVTEDLITQTSYLLTNLVVSGCRTITLCYSNDQISQLLTNINQDAFLFDYDQIGISWAKVTNSRGVATKYTFVGDQLVSQVSEGNENLDYCQILSNQISCMIKDDESGEEFTDFTFGVNENTDIDVSSHGEGYSNSVLNNNLLAKKIFLFYAEIDGNLGQDSFEIQLLDYDDYILADLVYEGETRILFAPVGIKASRTKEFYLKYVNNSSNLVTIVEAHLVPLIGGFEKPCLNAYIGGTVFYYDDDEYSVLDKGLLTKYNNTACASLNILLTANDFLINEKVFFKRDGDSFHLWANDQKELIDDVSEAFVSFTLSKSIKYNVSDDSIRIVNNNVVGSVVSFYKIKGQDDQSFSATKISHNSDTFHTGYTSLYYEEMETRYVAGNNGNIIYYDYDDNYSLVELNRNDGYKEEYEYDTHANLISKTISHSSFNKQIKVEYEYDSIDNLVTSTDLIGASLQTSSFLYDAFGNLSQTTFPNNLEHNATFDSVTGERNLNVSFEDTNQTNIQQNSNYIDADNSSYSTNGNTYVFNYDEGKLNSVSYNNQNIVSFTYTQDSGPIIVYTGVTITYSNGGSFSITYDAFNRVYVEGSLLYQYDDFSNVVGITDSTIQNGYTLFTYDYFNCLTNLTNVYDSLSVSNNYDIYHRVTNQEFTLYNTNLYTVYYSYNTEPGQENLVSQSHVTYDNSGFYAISDYDSFSRLSYLELTIGQKRIIKEISYCYGGPNNSLTNRMVSSVSSYTETIPFIINRVRPLAIIRDVEYYTYDELGNITSIITRRRLTVLSSITYEYDGFSRLTRENNSLLDKTFTYSYDNNGNIISKNEHAYSVSVTPPTPTVTHTYSYSQSYPNRLTSYDNQTITYDNVGNIVSFGNKSFSWTKGTLLEQVTDSSNNQTISFTYDGQRRRISKSINGGSNITYAYLNNQLMIENRGSSGVLKFIYTHQGVSGFFLNYTLYVFEKNIEQDVIAIRDSTGSVVAKYVYDAWGNHLVLDSSGVENTSSSFAGNINPFRYRSYYYDTDLKMYWLETRYYDPALGRFISPDHYSYLSYQKLHGLNLYAYSKNNPVMYYDPSGHFVVSLFIGLGYIISAAALGTAIAGTIHDISTLQKIDEKLEGYGVVPEGNNVKINGSSKVLTPWMQFAYSFYLNHIKSDTRDIIKGSTFGVQFEWLLHNIYYLFNGNIDAKDVDVGPTIFADNHKDNISDAMKLFYVAICIFFGFGGMPVREIRINGGWK